MSVYQGCDCRSVLCPLACAPQPTAQETLRLIRTKTVVYPANLTNEAVDFMKRWAMLCGVHFHVTALALYQQMQYKLSKAHR